MVRCLEEVMKIVRYFEIRRTSSDRTLGIDVFQMCFQSKQETHIKMDTLLKNKLYT